MNNVSNKTFCYECRDDVTYTVIEKELVGQLKGKNYTYKGKIAFCDKCNDELFIDEINDFNLIELYKVYREKNNIISLENVIEIPLKYNIGKRPLSLLLGWGELTYTRYCDGVMPTIQYSDTLMKLYNNPQYYYEILENNKDKLKSVTYEKSKEAVLRLIENEKTIMNVTNYLISECKDITPLALQKSLYYIQGFYFSFTNNYLFKDDCQAWVHGPVYPDVYDRYKEYRYNPISITNNHFNNKSVFNDYELLILDSVIHNICCYSGSILESMTHLEDPWINARNGLGTDEASTNVINKENIGNYFLKIRENYSILEPSEISKYTKDMFEKVK